MDLVIIILALCALLCIIFEDVIGLDKAKSTLFIGTLCWLLAYIASLGGHSAAEITASLNENILEIANLWLFLMATMTFVAYLNSKDFINIIAQKILPKKIHARSLLFFLGIFCFIFSSLADNVTATLVSIAIITGLKVDAKTKLKYATLIVFAVNSGGVSLITGDVTTLMIFTEGKVTIPDLLLLIVPSFIGVMTLALLLCGKMQQSLQFDTQTSSIDRRDKVVAVLFFCTIVAALALNILFQAPPMLSFLFGLSCTFLYGHFSQHRASKYNVLNYIRQIEFETLFFFLGILLIVGILKEIGVLNQLTELYRLVPTELANYLLGICSALIDNVPLTAALLKADVSMSEANWLAVTYATGVGGSLLIIGSAAGIIAMSKVKEISFLSYFSFFVQLLIAYSVGYILSYWVGRYFLG